ncbi:MAG: ArnT family glycosyltransferase [Candidatus Hodarchaeales archaeon]|jgi:4-amino-4-deoxy-L-arabinose transferase-like glycosyltransferase
MTAGSTELSSFKTSIHHFFKKSARRYHKHDNIYTPILLSIIIGCIGIILKIYQLHSIGMWDEGWYVNILRTMSETGDWFLPVYFGEGDKYYLFDKPPFLFWVGSFFASIFGYNSFAAKLPMALSAGLLGVIGFFIYDVSKKKGTERVAGVFTGLLAASAYFISIYGRTAYLDTAVIFFSSLTVVLAMRTFDNALENKYRKGSVYAVLLGVIMTVSIFAKAWQGLIVGPSIAIYIISRFCDRFLKKEYFEDLYDGIKRLKIRLSDDYYSEVFAILSGTGAFVLITLFNGEPSIFSLEDLGIAFQLNILAVVGGLLTAFLVKVFCDTFEINPDREKTVLRILGYFLVTLGALGGVIVGTKVNDTIISTFRWVSEEIFTGLGFPEIAEPTIITIGVVLFGTVSLMVILAAAVVVGAIIFNDHRYNGFFLNFLLLVPLAVAGSWIVYWFMFVLLRGDHFNREPGATALVGLVIPLLLIVFTIFLLLIAKQESLRRIIGNSSTVQRISSYLDVNFDDYVKFFLFFCFVLVLITLSFFPLNAWIWYIDTNLESIGFPIRVPGELAKYMDELPETGISMEYIFYHYYIGWRYTHETKYDLFGSLHGLKDDPIFVIGIPFFFMGIYYFIRNREFSKGLLLSSWFIIVLVSFLPSKFQLDYYYLAVFLPYYAIVAKGMVESIRKGSGTVIRDFKERMIITVPFYVVILLPLVDPLLQFLSVGDLIGSFSHALGYFLQDHILINTVLFTCVALIIVRTVPGIVTLMIAIPYMTSVLLVGRLGFRNTFLFFIVLGCILVLLYQERKTLRKLSERYAIIKNVEKRLVNFLASVNLSKTVLTRSLLLKYVIGVLVFILFVAYVLFGYKPLDIKLELLLFVTFLSAGVLASLSRSYPAKSLFLVLIVILTSAGSVSKLVHYNDSGNMRYDECATYILSHGGDFNDSTWVFDESGAIYAMRYMLGYEIIVGNVIDNPFSRYNASSLYNASPGDIIIYENYRTQFNQYINTTPAKFWVIITREHWERTPMTDYTTTWGWFVNNTHIENVSFEAGIPETSIVRLYVNTTWINEMGY